MPILAYIETDNNQIKKQGYELASYACDTARVLDTEAHAIVLGTLENPQVLGEYGISKVIQIADPRYDSYQDRAASQAISEIAKSEGYDVLAFSQTSYGGSIAPEVAIKCNAGIASGVVALPNTDDGFVVKKSVFSGKAFAYVKINSDIKVLNILPGSYSFQKGQGEAAVDQKQNDVDDSYFNVTTISREKISGKVPLNEADIVVSGGRGMKGPENWNILEDLAEELNASLACSRPVADSGWRPHHEHVGQTGGTIRPKLYIANGISGAIQHLAGVNNSKNILVVNTDAEAPFFGSADYGVVGDVMEVIPKLTEEIKKYKASKS